MPQNFDPNPADPIVLFEQEYVVQPHPQAPYLPYRQKAGRARVYQLRNGQEGQYFALKEFKKLYRTPSLIDSYQNLHRVEDFKGLQAARRRIVLPDDPAAQRHPNLQYAMLMPWIHGTTWFDVLGQAREGDYPDLATAISLCNRFLEVMEGLEKAGMAHTDISPGNVMVGFDPIDVQLLDLEDMYMPGVDAPLQPHSGSNGYSHRSGEATWKPEGDRYAAAVLAAEMVILAKPELARKATDEGFFTNHCATPEGAARFQQARLWLEEVAPKFARVFERSWYADSLEECPSIFELREPVKELATRTLAPESPEQVETPISRQPSTGSKAAVETPLTNMNQRQDWWKQKEVLGAVAAAFAGVAWIAWGFVPLAHQVLTPSFFYDPPFNLSLAMLGIGVVGMLGGLVSLHAQQKTSYGRLGMTGFLVAFVGTALLFSLLAAVFVRQEGPVTVGTVLLGFLPILVGFVLLQRFSQTLIH